MTAYRLYFVTPDGHIREPPILIECNDDAHAMAEAVCALGVEHPRIEVWEGQRLIGRLTTADTQPAEPPVA